MEETTFVSSSWLEAHRSDSDVRIVDVRDEWEFEGIGHIPGAVNVPFDRFRSDDSDDPGTLPGAEVFAALLETVGISTGDTIVAYDDTHGVFAARFIVTARMYGHRDARMLDGDFSSWSREYPTTRESTTVEQSDYQPRPLTPDECPLIDRTAVESALASDALFVDTREHWEFEAAHLPGAVRFDWREVVDTESRGLLSRATIERLLTARGITRNKRIVLYCNTARRISHTYLVLRWLGFTDVAFYEGSLTEWLDTDGPIVSGDGVVE